jgi:hypothetical protein
LGEKFSESKNYRTRGSLEIENELETWRFFLHLSERISFRATGFGCAAAHKEISAVRNLTDAESPFIVSG